MWMFDLEEVAVHLSMGVRGVLSNLGRAQWSGCWYCCLKEEPTALEDRRGHEAATHWIPGHSAVDHELGAGSQLGGGHCS